MNKEKKIKDDLFYYIFQITRKKFKKYQKKYKKKYGIDIKEKK